MTMFTTLKMLGVIEQAGPAPSWLRDTFFGNVETHDTAKIALDFEYEGRTMAPFVSGKVGAKFYDRDTFKTSVFEAPHVSPGFITYAEDHITKRIAGEAITGALTPAARAMKELGKDLGKLDRMITRREEWMVASLLFNGNFAIKGEGVDAELSFWKNTDAKAPYVALAAGKRWNEEGADIYEDLRDAQERAMTAAGVRPDTAVLDRKASAAVLKNEGFRKQLDTSQMTLAEIKPYYVDDDLMFIGRVVALGLDLFMYTGKHENDAGQLVDYVPEKHVLLGKRGGASPTIMNYGVVALADPTKNAIEYMVGRRVPESWVERSPAGRILQMRSRPLPVLTKVGAFQVLKVLA